MGPIGPKIGPIDFKLTHFTRTGPLRPVWVSFSAYPFEDQQILVQALKDNFDIETTIQKDHQYSTLYIRSKSTERFVNLIRPYLHPCFDSKIKNTAEGPSP